MSTSKDSKPNVRSKPPSFGLGALIFTRDPTRHGKTKRVSEGLSYHEVEKQAANLKIDQSLIPEMPSDRKALSRILSRVYATGGRKGISTKQVKKDASGIIVEIYERPKGGGKMDLVGTLQWQTDKPDEIVGIDHWLVHEIREEYSAKHGRIGLNDWTDKLRNLVLDTWCGLPARHEGRVYWVPQPFLDQARAFGELAGALEIFGVIIVPVPEDLQAFISTIIIENVEELLEEREMEVARFNGREAMSRYRRVTRLLTEMRKRIAWYEQHAGGALSSEDAKVLDQNVSALLRTVQVDYVGPAEAASEQVPTGSLKKTPKTGYLALPKNAPPPPEPPTPAELAPLPEPYITVDDLVLKRAKSLDSDSVIAFAAEAGAPPDALAKRRCNKWLPVKMGHVFLTVDGGPPRVYLTAPLDPDLALQLMTIGLTLHI